jgi:thiamine kinase-like enzyme
VHTDVRADNILITRDNEAVLVDWPWACVGSAWVDALTMLINVRVFDPDFDVDSVVQSHEVFAPATAGSVNRVLSGLGAYFTDAARQPPPPGLPTVRAFQRQQGEAVSRWLRQRLTHL